MKNEREPSAAKNRNIITNIIRNLFASPRTEGLGQEEEKYAKAIKLAQSLVDHFGPRIFYEEAGIDRLSPDCNYAELVAALASKLADKFILWQNNEQLYENVITESQIQKPDPFNSSNPLLVFIRRVFVIETNSEHDPSVIPTLGNQALLEIMRTYDFPGFFFDLSEPRASSNNAQTELKTQFTINLYALIMSNSYSIYHIITHPKEILDQLNQAEAVTSTEEKGSDQYTKSMTSLETKQEQMRANELNLLAKFNSLSPNPEGLYAKFVSEHRAIKVSSIVEMMSDEQLGFGLFLIGVLQPIQSEPVFFLKEENNNYSSDSKMVFVTVNSLKQKITTNREGMNNLIEQAKYGFSKFLYGLQFISLYNYTDIIDEFNMWTAAIRADLSGNDKLILEIIKDYELKRKEFGEEKDGRKIEEYSEIPQTLQELSMNWEELMARVLKELASKAQELPPNPLNKSYTVNEILDQL